MRITYRSRIHGEFIEIELEVYFDNFKRLASESLRPKDIEIYDFDVLDANHSSMTLREIDAYLRRDERRTIIELEGLAEQLIREEMTQIRGENAAEARPFRY